MSQFDAWADDAILEELGIRLRQERLNRNITQEELARAAGISIGALRNAESGGGSSLTTFVRMLRALGLLHRVEAVLPEAEMSPIELSKRRGRERLRASGQDRSQAIDDER
ncbi:MAG: XRE family transcriptional regulator [Armatimonadetes bacterium]|nr:MAG: XRE family transcriptional regulator [Armatimonadota bacterium]